ncbi:unnamed protein product [Periconia digitata]|uniref:GPI inositol-deacylase winged helix domain-containing protein n=1 Tax=Periconia digitata TaxID=1303443 RepID=A0A9W4U0L3_9PLEO|nr:unnamed protein product [Periconia digitata]
MQLQYLCSFSVDDDIKRRLGRLPPDLHTLYDELYQLLAAGPGATEAAVFKNALQWLLCARRALRTEEFLCAVSLDVQQGQIVSLASKDHVLKICNNFVVFDSELDTFRFAHLSVREYLEQKPEYSRPTTNALAAEVCLWTVISTSPSKATQKLLAEMGWQAETLRAELKDLSRYADIYWAEHCRFAKEFRSSGRLKAALEDMLLSNGGASSSIALWNKRLERHLENYDYRYLGMPLVDTIPATGSLNCTGLLVSCAFDFVEHIEVVLQSRIETIQCVNQRGHGPLDITIANGNCAALAFLLTLDQQETKITQKMVVAAAGNYRNGKEVMALLLEQRGSDIEITKEVVVAAAGNEDNGKEVMALLLEQRGSDIEITKEVVVAAAGNYRNGKEVMALLLEQRGSDIEITKEVVVAAAGNYRNGKEVMALLLEQRGSDIEITKEVVVAAAGNENNGEEVMALLLEQRGSDIEITKEVVVLICCNFDKEIVALLLKQRGSNIEITKEVVVAAAGNYRNGKEVMALLLEQRGSDIEITKEVVAAAANSG